MAYRNFKTLEQVVDKLGVSILNANLFKGMSVDSVAPTAWLLEAIERSQRVSLRVEKPRSEFLIAPVMGEIVMRNEEQVALFSGEIMNAKPEDDLNGEVDFLFSAKPHSSILEAPILSVIEAKRGDIEISQGQCAAQMIGAYYFNQKKGRDLKEIYGCVTTGNEWAFMKLKDNVLYIDTKRYFISDLGQILGIFQYIIDNYDLK